MQDIRVLVVGEQALFCSALGLALEREPDLRVVGRPDDGRDAMVQAVASKPDVILLDVDLDGGKRSLMPMHDLRRRIPEASVIVLSEEEDDDDLAEAVEAGIRGYVTKTSHLDDLIETTRRVYRGETDIPSTMLGELLTRLVHGRETRDNALTRILSLGRQEQVILRLLAEGRSQQEIGEELVISTSTVRTHIQHLLEKLGIHSRLEAVALVMQNRLLETLPEPRSQSA